MYSLPDLWMRPAFGGKGRKAAGELQAHANGFRYTSGRGEEVDVMYRNIKHAFFQPAQNEMITLVHFHLIHPIMVGRMGSMAPAWRRGVLCGRSCSSLRRLGDAIQLIPCSSMWRPASC